MQQHPIPQNVTAYEFHLIGNMTIKQFLELGVGIGIGVIFYATALPNFIKWPIIFISVLGGGALAFLPFDGRPLDRMVVVFFRAVYAPTQYIWRKESPIPKFFSFKPHPQSSTDAEREKLKLRKNLGEYLNTLPQNNPTTPHDENEVRQLNQINQLFQTTPAATQVAPSQTVINHPSPKVRIRKIKPQNQISQKKTSVPQIPQTSPISAPDKKTPTKTIPTQTTTIDMPQAETSPTPIKTNISKQALQNKDLPFPQPPQTPNTIVGMVLDSKGKIVDNAIIEVKDQNNQPVRALKSNQLGQFFSATPLPDGEYEIQIEKDKYNFNTIKISLTGEIVQPLEIHSD